MISPNFSQLGLRPRRLKIKRYHARFRAIMVKYAARLVHDQLVERWSTEREVAGFHPWLNRHSGLKTAEEEGGTFAMIFAND